MSGPAFQSNNEGEQEADEMSDTSKDANKSADAASTGSSAEKSGSGGGYSADCSASDQSSDDNGEAKTNSSGEQLSISRLDLASNNSSNASDSRGDTPVTDEARDDGNIKAEQHQPKSSCRHQKEEETTREPSHTKRSDKKTPAYQISRLKSPLSIDIDSVLNYSPETEEIPALDGAHPQLNGVKITHPMDPRIDLSTVTRIHAAGIPPIIHHHVHHRKQEGSKSNQHTEWTEPVSTIDQYQKLMEVVRPFFIAHGISIDQLERQAKQDADQTQSSLSEGFTSFFTTTHSGTSNKTTNSTSPTSSDMDKKNAPQKVIPATGNQNQDDASMKVLAHSKHRHRLEGGESGCSSSSSWRLKQVRIQEAHQDDNDANNQDETRAREAAAQQESSSSSSDVGHQNAAQIEHFAVPPRIVTDISSSNPTDSATHASNFGSGSGSSGNTGNEMNSASNLGSSGSGNEGKGSSEELGKEENSGDGTNGSDSSGKRKFVLEDEPAVKRHEHHHTTNRNYQNSQRQALTELDEFSREKKLLDKKRKRIEMRREYEAQQHLDSSESSNDVADEVLKPGRAVNLDKVLAFSKIPRIVIQAEPPFLVVHTNAAYTRLTGIESHVAVGKPISALLSIPHIEQSVANGNSSAGSSTQPNNVTNNRSVEARRHDSIGLERLVAACGFGKLHMMEVSTKAHDMLGNNVTFMQNALVAPPNERRGNGSSVGGSDGTNLSIQCIASIAPVVSNPSYMDVRTSIQERKMDEMASRKKARGLERPEDESERKIASIPESHHEKKQQSRHIVTHYAIQLRSRETSAKKHDSNESLSSNSTSVEARLIGLSKAELQRQRMAVGGSHHEESSEIIAEEDGVASESTEAKDAVSAIG